MGGENPNRKKFKKRRKLIRYVMHLTDDGTKQTEAADIIAEQENVDGFVDIQQQRKRNMERLTKTLSEYDRMKTLDDRISEIWQLPEFSTVLQEYDDDDDYGN